MRITFIVNTADQRELGELRSSIERLRRDGHEVEVRVTFEGGDAWRFAREGAEGGAEVVIAAGGDGTVNEVANGLYEARASRGAEARLGIVPLGTGNDLASGLELPMEIATAVETAVGGRTREIDVACVDGRCFLNVSTGGFGAEATDEASSEIKRALGSFAYLMTGAKKFVGLEPVSGRFVTEEVVFDGPFLLFAVGNSRRTGGGTWLTPRAELADGLLDLCVVKQMSRMEFMKLLPDLRAGRHVDNPGVIYRQAPRIRVEPASPISVNVDGEPLAERPWYEYTISPQRIAVMVPGPETGG